MVEDTVAVESNQAQMLAIIKVTSETAVQAGTCAASWFRYGLAFSFLEFHRLNFIVPEGSLYPVFLNCDALSAPSFLACIIPLAVSPVQWHLAF